jgi:biotin synthase-related radical SAM superfamily protein
VAPDRGALCVARCGQAAKETAGLPVEVQFESPRDLTTINQVYDMDVDALGIHVESFDPAVLARVAPGKFRTGIETYFRTWKHAVALFGEGRVSTYVIHSLDLVQHAGASAPCGPTGSGTPGAAPLLRIGRRPE